MPDPQETTPSQVPPFDPLVFVGENEGQPLVVMLDQSFGRGFCDKSRGQAVMVEIRLERVDGNGLPPVADWPGLEEVEAALVKEFAETDDDWRFVARTYGEGVARYCFYGRKTSSAPARTARVLGDFPAAAAGHTVTIQADPTWAAYNAFFPGDERGDARGDAPGDDDFAPSFRDDDGPPGGRAAPTKPYRREEQPWRGEESQAHPED